MFKNSYFFFSATGRRSDVEGVIRSLIRHSVFLTLFVILPASAEISVYPMNVGVGKDGNATVKVLSGNTGTDFVRVSISKIINPGTPKEEERRVNSFTVDDLAVTPMKIAISPGAERLVRLVSISPPSRETTWRVYFENVPADEFENISGHESKARTAQVGISIVWGVLVHVAPSHVIASATYKPETGELSNTGTIRLPLQEVETCDISHHCEWRKVTATIYPGMTSVLKNITFQREKIYRIKYKNWITDKEEEIPLLSKERK